MKRFPILFVSALLILSAGCHGVPQDAQSSDVPAHIWPDYSEVAIPCNIAPLVFQIEDEADAYRCVVRGEHGKALVTDGRTVRVPIRSWKALLEANTGGTIRFEIFEKNGGKWVARPPVRVFVAPDPVDRYLTYRLIEPTYGMAGAMSISQRDLTTFREKDIFNNQLDYDRNAGQCINCHSFQNWHAERMQFHIRQKDGGTIIADKGNIRKVNLKADGFLSAGVYPSWHPAENLIAYSLNRTQQFFYAKGIDKTEVVDADSDIILYDPAANRARMVAGDTLQLETFPYWSPDGRMLYYVSADISRLAPMREYYYGPHYDELKYNLMRIPFDPGTRSFGTPECFFDAAGSDKSATFPRISPDGRYLLFTLASFGQFHIWHRDADLYLQDLSTGDLRPLAEVNSEETESYHSWSSNGRWIVFSSRRDDRTYTRLYLAWFDAEGRAHKPFLLPQRDPQQNIRLFKSYNIPEFTVDATTLSPKDFLKAAQGPAIQAEN